MHTQSGQSTVIIIGGGIIGSSIAYFLASQPDFKGSVTVIEKDTTYFNSATARSVGGIRMQFSTPENIEISKFGAEFFKSANIHLQTDITKPDFSFTENGYLFLATPKGSASLKQLVSTQHHHKVPVLLLSPAELAYRFPWLRVEDLAGGSLGIKNEGWLDPYSVLAAFIQKIKSLGGQFLQDEVVSMQQNKEKIGGIKLKSGVFLNSDFVVNAAGPNATQVAQLAGIHNLPVRSRKRLVFSFCSPQKIQPCPLVIDPSGVYFRPEGNKFICGVSPPEESDPDCTDFELDYSLFDEVIWPVLARRVPAFDTLKRDRSWAGHYAYNIIDQNAILGYHPQLSNFIFANGFSGHGFQQAPAVGRAISELILYGSYQTLNLDKFSFERFEKGELIQELKVV